MSRSDKSSPVSARRRPRGWAECSLRSRSEEPAHPKETPMALKTTAALAATAALLSACNLDSTPPLACSEITTARLNIANLSSVSAVEVAASGALPAHCQITGALNARTGIDGQPYAIGFELRTPLPQAWNG
eukprot:gene53067-70941_t